jgi:hypothetical protein
LRRKLMPGEKNFSSKVTNDVFLVTGHVFAIQYI